MGKQNKEAKPKKPVNVKYLVKLALLSAVMIVMMFTPVGYLRISAVEITFLCLPIILAAILLGPLASTFLGLVFGISSFIQCFGLSPFGSVLLGINLFLTFVMCVVPRVATGFLAGAIFKVLKKAGNKKYVITAASTSLLNTILFSTFLLWFFGNAEEFLGFLSSEVVKLTLGLFVTQIVVNGIIEVLACGLLGFAIGRIALAVDKRAEAKAQEIAQKQPVENSSEPQE